MRQIVLTPAGKTVAKTAIFTSLVAFVIGILTVMLMDDKGLGFIPALLAAAGILVASTLVLLISIFGICWAFVVIKQRYDAWYCRTGFRKDLEKLTKRGLINPAHAKVSKPKTKKTTSKRTSKKSSKK